ncbi:MAG: YraN family protein [Myxococcales bacterium]|nr:YraN family protein [Polyangiaceae bacterium]MDW8249239.1 YraN family protein [Myxococcales bacterium]
MRRGEQPQLSGRPSDRRRIGTRAEQVAADYYWTRGFQIEGRNLHLGRLEVDLLVRQGPLLVLVEVRARGPGAFQGPFASVRGCKLRNLRTAMHSLWRRYQFDPTVGRIRLDIAAVNLWKIPVEIEVAEAVVP